MRLRFFLDQDVDVAVRTALKNLGHECWTAHEAGLGTNRDDELTVYAYDRDAILVTHDREFSNRRRRTVVGRHIYLECNEWDAADLLARHLDDLIPLLERQTDVFVHVTVTGFSLHRAWT